MPRSGPWAARGAAERAGRGNGSQAVFNHDTETGETDADRWTLNIQPVIPFDLTEDLNLISRTMVSTIDVEPPVRGGKDTSGLGDTVQSFSFSPKAPASGGWILGGGPVLLIATGKDDLTADQWGLGPTFVALKQEDGWTYGALADHIWGIDAPSDRDSLNNTFLRPFVRFTTPDALTLAINTEPTSDWNAEDWTVPVNVLVSEFTHFGEQPVQFQFGYRNYLDAPSGDPSWGLRLNVIFFIPK